MIMTQDKSGDSMDPEFLTFRHNSPGGMPTSGRSIYSQRFDYKSLEKYPIFDTHNSERDDAHLRNNNKIKNMIKNKKMRNVRSQEKKKEFFGAQSWQNEENLFEEERHEFGKFAHLDDLKKKREARKLGEEIMENKGENYDSVDVEEKNLDLKQKIAKITRAIKKEQRKELTLDSELQEFGLELEEKDKEIEEQQKSIEELTEISNENLRECDKIISHIEDLSRKNDSLASQLETLEESVDSSEISIETFRQDGLRERMICTQLKEGISDLSRMKSNAEHHLSKLEEEIAALEEQIDQMRGYELDLIRIFGLTGESESNNSSIPFHNHSNSHSHNSNSSRASCEDKPY